MWHGWHMQWRTTRCTSELAYAKYVGVALPCWLRKAGLDSCKVTWLIYTRALHNVRDSPMVALQEGKSTDSEDDRSWEQG